MCFGSARSTAVPTRRRPTSSGWTLARAGGRPADGEPHCRQLPQIGATLGIVLRRLEHHGLIDADRHGQRYSYALNREHVLVPGLEQLHRAMPTVQAAVQRLVTNWAVAPAALLLFGSAARRDGDAASDV